MMTTEMTTDALAWRNLLCVVAAFNLLIWSGAAIFLYRRQASMHPEIFVMRRWQLILSAIYVVGCAYRSAIPVFDVPRIVFFDSWLSSVMIGRSVATIAELSFVAQWAVMLREASIGTDNKFGLFSSRVIFPLIVIAEMFSWYSVLTTSNIGHVVEESLWGTAAALLVVNLIAMGPHCSKAQRRMLDICCLLGIAYVTYMFTIDVPRYWTRWTVDEIQGRHYLTIAQGFIDVSSRWTVSRGWNVWQGEMTWMSLYFSVAVWLSIFFVHAPVLQRQAYASTKNAVTKSTSSAII